MLSVRLGVKDRKGLYLCFLGSLCIFAWGILLFQLLYSYFFDKSSILGFDDNYGIVIIAHNLYGEMPFEFFLFLGIIIASIYMFYYLIKRY